MRSVLLTLLVVHTAVTFFALKDENIWAVFPPFQEPFVYQIFSDLATSIGIVLVLCYVQLKKKRRPMRGLVITTIGAALFGSFSPLVYLLIEKDLFDA